MQRTIKVVGIIVEPRGQYAARLKVVSCKKGSEWITDQQILTEEFPPIGCVFAGNILEKYKVGDLIDLNVVEYSTAQLNPSNDNYKIEPGSNCRAIGHRLYKMEPVVKFDELSIDLAKVKERIEAEGLLKDFYIQVENEVFGPLNLDGEELTAAKEIGVSTLSNLVVATADQYAYLIKRPSPEKKIDAMSIGQLSVWFKERLKHQNVVSDFDGLKRALETQSLAHLDSVRMRRAFDQLDQLELSQNDLSILCQYSQNFAELFEKALNQANDEIVKPALETKKLLLDEVSSLQKDKDRLLNQILMEKESLKSLKSELFTLENERQRYIDDIRIHARVGQNSTPVSTLIKYEVLDFLDNTGHHASIPAFLGELKKNLNLNDNEQQLLVGNAAIQLTHFNCLLASQLEMIYHLARASNNCRVFLQQAEADWLKFDSFYENGLKDVWESAHENPSIIHFFILQDFNLAIIDCYAKPLLDLNIGFRKVLPGTGKGFPKNLRIFAIPIRNNSPVEFGLPLMKESFANWGAFPKVSNIQLPSESIGPLLTVEAISIPMLNPICTFENYFED